MKKTNMSVLSTLWSSYYCCFYSGTDVGKLQRKFHLHQIIVLYSVLRLEFSGNSWTKMYLLEKTLQAVFVYHITQSNSSAF